jgi:ABC transport system ATP-binding/permease protein
MSQTIEYLLVRLPDQPEKKVTLQGNTYRLGRGPDNELVLPFEEISRHHGVIERRPDGWIYNDSNSTNGSYVNGERIRQVSLKEGMWLQLGKHPKRAVLIAYQAVVQVQSLEQNKPVGAVAAVQTLRQDPESSTGMVPLVTYQPPAEQTITIGRDPLSSIQLESPVVSRKHAILKMIGVEWWLQDNNSHNGTSVNGRRILAAHQMKNGDIVQIGPYRLVYQGAGKLQVAVASHGLRLDGQSLTWEVGKPGKRKRILDNVNISCNPQEFVGLVGGSGAGKTTLMKALSGLLPSKGNVLVEGDDLYRNYDAYRAQIGYVPQDDILHKELTVQQALWYSARLRLPSDVGAGEIQKRIQRVLEQVELAGQKDQPIHSLSGGQRKRASIAVELLADPPLFFLDEPTSGLDPGLEKKMMVTLRKLADGGKTILLVTHATANITECDQVAFMSQGRMVYYGPPQQAGEFFQVGGENFSDIYTEISDPDPKKSKVKAEGWAKRFQESPFFQRFIVERFKTLPKGGGRGGVAKQTTMKRARVSSLHQFFLLTRRYFDLVLRDRILLTILLAIMPLLAILVLMIAKSDWLVGLNPSEIDQYLLDKIAGGASNPVYSVAGKGQALLFIMSMASVLLGLFASAYEVVKERTIYQRERMVFLRLLPYVASKVLLLGVFSALQCLLFLVVINFKVYFPTWGVLLPALLEIYITLFLGSLAAIMLGLFLSSIAPNSNAVVYLILGVLFIQMLFAGVLFELPGASANLSKITLTRWTTEALGASVDLGELNAHSRTRFTIEEFTQEVEIEVEKPDPNNGMQIEKEWVTKEVTIPSQEKNLDTPFKFELDYNHDLLHLLGDWFMLIFLSLLFGIGTLIALKKKDVV